MVAQTADQRADGEMRLRHQNGGYGGRLKGLQDAADVGAGFVLADAAQEIVAADAHQREIRFRLHQPGQAGKGLCGRVA